MVLSRRTMLACVFGAGALATFCASPALAHPGSVARDGCHYNRRTGQRHCHPGRARGGWGRSRRGVGMRRRGSTRLAPRRRAMPAVGRTRVIYRSGGGLSIREQCARLTPNEMRFSPWDKANCGPYLKALLGM